MLQDPDGPWLWPSDLDSALKVNWLDSLAYMYYNATLWARIGELWPGEAGQASLHSELSNFRATRAAVLSGCQACEQQGAHKCLESARTLPSQVTPHFCWSLRQDTKSWSEHFFKRAALRFDAAAAVRPPPPSRGGHDDAGVKTGNVQWWRCQKTRAVAARCAELRDGAPSYSLWDCACQW